MFLDTFPRPSCHIIMLFIVICWQFFFQYCVPGHMRLPSAFGSERNTHNSDNFDWKASYNWLVIKSYNFNPVENQEVLHKPACPCRACTVVILLVRTDKVYVYVLKKHIFIYILVSHGEFTIVHSWLQCVHGCTDNYHWITWCFSGKFWSY